MNHWDARFLEIARLAASWSKDRSRHAGCVLVRDRAIIATGFNGFPRGVREGTESTEDRHERPAKYFWTEHSERNAIFNAARNGVSTEGCTAYVATSLADGTRTLLHPCADCMRAMIQSGIKRIVCAPPDFKDPVFGEGFRIAQQMAIEADVQVEYYK